MNTEHSTDNQTVFDNTDKILQINWDNVCAGCMRELTEEEFSADVCPYCGFSSVNEERSYALPEKTILNGKYIIGRLLSSDENKITYLGYDLNLQTLLQVEELYPSNIISRQEDKANVILIDEQYKETFEEKKSLYIEESKKSIKNNTESGCPVTIKEIFEENNTVYKALSPSYDDSPSEILQSFIKNAADTQKSSSKKWIFIIIASVLVLSLLIAIILVSSGKNKKETENESSSVSSEPIENAVTHCYNPAFLTGTYYTQDNIAIFPVGSGIYFCETDGNNGYGTCYPLMTLENDLIAFITCDQDYIYFTDSSGGGIYRIQIDSDVINPTLITSTPAWSVKVTDEYIYYSDTNSLYRAKKDGTNEITISKTASDYFSITDDKIYYHSNQDGNIYSCELDGSNSRFLLNAGEISDLLVIDDYMYINQNGNIYQYDIPAESLVGDTPISTASLYTELFELKGCLFFIAENDSGLNKYDPELNKCELIFDEVLCSTAAPMGDNILVMSATDTGDYYIINAEDYTSTKLGFSYFDIMSTQNIPQ